MPDTRVDLDRLRELLACRNGETGLGVLDQIADQVPALIAEIETYRRALGQGQLPSDGWSVASYISDQSTAAFADPHADRVQAVADLVPADWDRRALTFAHELRRLLLPIVDQGTSIDSGGGDNCADIWPVIDGVEMHVQITASRPLPTPETTHER